MKHLVNLFAAGLITASIFLPNQSSAQAPNKMSYQAVIRNSSDALVTNQTIGMRISLLKTTQTGTAVYVETQTPTTNTNGLVSIEIGGGTLVSGNFSTIDWGNGPYFVKTEVDPLGGTNYSIIGTSQLLSVPYALFSANGVPGPQGPQGPQGLLLSGSSAGNTPYWDGTQWVVNNSNIHNNGAGVGIGTTTPNASAKVEIASTTQGFLPPRMTTTQRDAISSPAVGLFIYNTTVNCVQWWNGTTWHDGCGNNSTPNQPQYPAGSIFCASGPSAIVEVINPSTGKIWMDRNLGASQAATSSTDANAYGDLYQWGRGSDGHQCRTSATSTTLSSTDQPGNGNFILISTSPYDWRSPQNTNLWQGVNGVNNPCPSGFRLPTETELNNERFSWSSNNAAGAFASPLKFIAAGNRDYSNGTIENVGSIGRYWGSTVGSSPGSVSSRNLYFDGAGTSVVVNYRSTGYSVRCIKN